MQPINRNAIIVSAKNPLIDWVNTLDPKNPMPYRNPLAYDESTVYLIDVLDTEEDFREWLSENYLEIFEEELYSWITDDSLWPNPLTFDLFNTWISVSYQSMVMDMSLEEPLIYDE